MILSPRSSAAQIILLILCFYRQVQVFSQNNAYKRPPADVAAIVEARPTPNVSISPARDAMLLIDYNPNPGVAILAQPFLKLGGLRVNPKINARQRITEFVGVTVQWIAENNKSVRIEMPGAGRLAGLPQWSPNSRRLAFAVDMPDHVQLWVSDTRTGKSARLGNFAINDMLGAAFTMITTTPARPCTIGCPMATMWWRKTATGCTTTIRALRRQASFPTSTAST